MSSDGFLDPRQTNERDKGKERERGGRERKIEKDREGDKDGEKECVSGLKSILWKLNIIAGKSTSLQ